MKGDTEMKAEVGTVKAIKGFLPTTYPVYCGERVLKIFTDKAEAEAFADSYNKGVTAR